MRKHRLKDTIGPSATVDTILVTKDPPANAGDIIRDIGSVSGLGRSPRGGHGNPLQYSCLENPIHKGAWGYSPWVQSMGSQRVGHDIERLTHITNTHTMFLM